MHGIDRGGNGVGTDKWEDWAEVDIHGHAQPNEALERSYFMILLRSEEQFFSQTSHHPDRSAWQLVHFNYCQRSEESPAFN